MVGKEQGRNGCESGLDGGACARQSCGGAGRAPSTIGLVGSHGKSLSLGR